MLRSDKVSQTMDETWEYASIIGMLMYPVNYSCPGITHVVYTCVRFIHDQKNLMLQLSSIFYGMSKEIKRKAYGYTIYYGKFGSVEKY